MKSLLQIGRGHAHSVRPRVTGTTFGAYFDLVSASFSELFLGGFLGGPWLNFGSILEPLGDHFASQNRSKK